MSEPTSSLTFSGLILEVAIKVGIAYYGADGSQAAQIPLDAHDLDLCKRVVNKAIRMFVHDAPPAGWRWARPLAEVDLWGTINTDPANAIATAVYDGSTLTTLTVPTDAFYATMELKTIVIGGVSLTINSYVNTKTITVLGDHHTVAGQTWSIACDGNFTLPATFGGQYNGKITFRAGTNRGVTLNWVDESLIRERRANVTQETGTPYQFAVRLMMTTATPRRRWELMAYRMPSEVLHVQFPYTLAFDSLVNLTEVQPAPFAHDETVKAAALAIAEKEVEDAINGPDWQYYRGICLPNSYRVDNLSGPRALGYFGNPRASQSAYSPIKDFRDNWYQRPQVPFNT